LIAISTLLSKNPKYSLVIPAYNEAERISGILSELDDEDLEYIFVCDGTDSTSEIITSHFQGQEHHIQCLIFSERKGKGGGIIAGFNATHTPFIGFIDADQSVSLKTIKKLFEDLEQALESNPDIGAFIGSRYVKDSNIEKPQPISRRIMSRCFNMATRVLFGLSYHDTQCGAKVCTKKAFDSISQDLTSTGFEFDVELIWRLEQAGYKVHEIGIEWTDTEGSHLSFSTPLNMFWGLIKLKWNAL